MFGRAERNYPKALTAGPDHGEQGLRDGLRWLMEKVAEVGGAPLIVAPGRANVDGNTLLSTFVKRTRVTVATWRSRPRDWYGGPVLAAWPTREKLGEIADDPRTAALCVVPWVKGEVDAWAAAESPELLGPATVDDSGPLDPVVVEGLKTLTAMVNMGNSLAGSLDHRDAVAVLRTLKDGGYHLAPDPIYSWAIANEWSSRGAERLRELAAKFDAGKRPPLKGGYPLRADILDVWRREANEDK